ncbi:hypothetical protein ACQEU8_22685 [Streptomyces sp. CA-250714]|uniref:hypothetical protein n=1 Tax=Streptomyces sp. CA-250714 TaxID=3240060 RepID=UPI003D942738
MTKAMAVAGVALSAATGCITVSGSPQAPGDGPSPQHSPVPGHGAAPPRLVLPSAKEALSRLPRQGTAPERRGTEDPQRRGASLRTGESGTAADTTARPEQQPPPRPAPLPRARDQAPAAGSGGAGPGPAEYGGPRGGAGGLGHHGRDDGRGHSGAAMCEWGETYGRWDPDSAQARICRDTYGR